MCWIEEKKWSDNRRDFRTEKIEQGDERRTEIIAENQIFQPKNENGNQQNLIKSFEQEDG